jgi:hypothetical protein
MTDEVKRLRELLAKATQLPWRLGADLCNVHPDWRDDIGNSTNDNYHRNGFAKRICRIGAYPDDWRDIEQFVGDGTLIVEAINALPGLLDTLESLTLPAEDVVERVARALCRHDGNEDELACRYEAAARAALASMPSQGVEQENNYPQCPDCGAPPGLDCRTIQGRTQPHESRLALLRTDEGAER